MDRIAPLILLSALLASPAAAQGWRPFEVEIQEELLNTVLERQHDATRRAARSAPREPAPEGLREALAELGRALIRPAGSRVTLTDGRLTLRARTLVFALVRDVVVRTELTFEVAVPEANLIVLRALSGQQKWGSGAWEPSDAGQLRSNLRRLSETLSEGELEGHVRVDSDPAGGARLVVDLSEIATREGVELHDVRFGAETLTVVGATRLERLELEIGGRDLSAGIRDMRRESPADLDALMGPNARVDVGHENPGKITFHGRADLPYLPTTRYAAVFGLRQTGPRQLELTLEDVTIGGDGLDGFLRSRLGAGVKRWILNTIYRLLDEAESEVDAAYERGEVGFRLSHTAPNVRVIDLRPGWAGGAVVRPGFALDGVRVEPGALRLGARLEGPAEPSPTGPVRRGLVGALGE